MTVCDATQYTTAVQDEMLCILDSVAVPDEAPLLYDASGPCDETVAWDDPHTLFVVHADGDWRLSW